MHSPFMPVEDAVKELKKLLLLSLANEKAKDDTLRKGIKAIEATESDLKKQMTRLVKVFTRILLQPSTI